MSPNAIKWRISQSADPSVEWKVVDFTLEEALDAPYELICEVEADASVDPDGLLGCDVKLTGERPNSTRACCGIVRRVEKGDRGRDRIGTEHTWARIFVAPALDALRHTRDSRIFQDKSAAEILEEVLNDALGPYGRTVELRLQATYPTRETCIQYMESNYDFVARLMEEEGIAYWFTHQGEQEVLVLGDVPASFDEVQHQGSGALRFRSGPGGVVSEHPEAITELRRKSSLTTSESTVRDYDWTHPSTPVEATDGGEDANGRTRARYRFGRTVIGGYADGHGYGERDVTRQASVEQQLRTARGVRAAGHSHAAGLAPGATFGVEGHPSHPELDADYVVIRVVHRGHPDRLDEGYVNEFECAPKDVPWRPTRVRSKPRVRSTEVAKVVGPAGEEIHTDEHGRVRVQFDWDRLGTNDERSTCFLRVMQPWAGQGWGHVWLPRIGMEVVVEFVHGDIDRPLVRSAIYDGANRTPYPLPDEKTKSTIKSNSSLGGGGFNELRLEDKAGSEEVYLHAQKDLDELVEADHDTTVGNNQTNTVGVDQTEDIGANQTLTVGANRTVHVKGAFDETIDAGETRTVSAGVSETISGGETRDVSGGLTETIDGGETRTINGALREHITAAHSRTTTASFVETITGALNQTVTGGLNITTPASYTVTALGGFNLTATSGLTLIAPAGNTVVAPAGHTSIDFEYDSQGGSKIELYAVKEGSFIFNQAVEVIRLAFGGAKIDVCGVKITVSGAFLEAKPLVTAKFAIRVCAIGAAFLKGKLRIG